MKSNIVKGEILYLIRRCLFLRGINNLAEMDKPVSKNNKNDVRVNNNITLNINLGDPLNLFAIIGGIYIVKRLVKKRNTKRKKMQWP